MLTGITYFRGNHMTQVAAERLLNNLCKVTELIPQYWNICDPVNLPFDQNNLFRIIEEMAQPKSVGTLVFFKRKKPNPFEFGVDLRVAPVQWTSPHNLIWFTKFTSDERILTHYLPRSVIPSYPDYATVPYWDEDKERYSSLKRSYTPQELIDEITNRQITLPFGPLGCLPDVLWFNYFGRVFVEAIGKDRLINAGWERVEEIGDGLACYATSKLDDPHSRERRSRIAKAIEEFVWEPGCKPEDKRILDFDFSEQLAAAPEQFRRNATPASGVVRLNMAGLSGADEKALLSSLEQAGASFDPKTKELKKEKSKKPGQK